MTDLAGGTGVSAPVMESSEPNYPVTLGLYVPERVARWRVIGNPIMVIPHLIFLYLLNIAAGVALIIAWFAALFTAQVPAGLYGFITGVHRYQYRVATFMLYLREVYPSFSLPSGPTDPGDDPAWMQVVPPAQYSRLTVFFRYPMAIPLAIVGAFVGIGLYLAMIVAFFAVLFTGRWPAGLRRFVLGALWYNVRVQAWVALVCDTYPPFTVG